MVTPLTELPEWKELTAHQAQIRPLHLRELFDDDPGRGAGLSVALDGLHFDYSKHRLTAETVALLVRLAEARGFTAKRAAMFAGEHVNTSEDRPALHIALRLPAGEQLEVDGTDVVAEVHATLDRMSALATAVRSGQVLGATGKPVKHVVNIGIGGSDLGPKAAYEALRYRVPEPFPATFVSNVDPGDIDHVLSSADPEETFFVISSKTFSTVETLKNAGAAKQWLTDRLPAGSDVTKHFAAVSNSQQRAGDFGVPADRVFEVPEWVGGRYSFDSAVGLALMVGIGPDAFREMLAGAHEIDQHFLTAPLGQNIPALMGLIGAWYINFWDLGSYAVLPYSADLGLLPAHLQQLEMESNGKRVQADGSPLAWATSAVTWGQPGTNGQHAFYQMLHQGTEIVPTDFIVVARPRYPLPDQHRFLVANALAQTAALAFGKTPEELRAENVPEEQVPHRTFPGNRPSTTIVVDELNPRSFGQLVAIYEHKTFTQGVVWGIDSFDQWGVELGKVLATQVDKQLLEGPAASTDSSTSALIERVRSVQAQG